MSIITRLKTRYLYKSMMYNTSDTETMRQVV